MNKSIRRIAKNNIHFLILSVLAAMLVTQFIVNGLGIVSNAVDNVVNDKQFDFYKCILKICIYMLLAVLCSYIKVHFGNLFSIKTMQGIRNAVAEGITYLRYCFYDDNGTGKISVSLLTDIKALKKLLSDTMPQIITGFVNAAIMLIYIFTLNRLLLLAVIISYPFVFLSVKLISKRILQLSKERRRLLDNESMQIYDTIGGIDIVKSYNLYDTMKQRIKALMLEIFDVEKKRAQITSVMESARMLIKWIPSIICVSCGAILVINNRLTVGELMAFVLITERLFEQLSSLPYYINESADAFVSAQRISSVINSPRERHGGITEFCDSKYAIEFDNVSFGYSLDKPVLKNVCFKIKKGEKTAIIGSSGSGKSTIFKIICGFYTPWEGSCKIFGCDFNDIDIEYARSKIALISQNIFLFPGTVRENIAYGNINADDDDIERACNLANIHSFIMSLPNGYDTDVGERGVKLSGGERQRIALARAFLKNADILLMDEPTSALDSENESLLAKAIENIKSDAAVIIIAHRLTTIQKCDKIIAIENGRAFEDKVDDCCKKISEEEAK